MAHWRRFGVLTVNFFSSVSIVNFEQVNADWDDMICN